MTRVVDTPIAKIEVPEDRLRELRDYSELAESMSRVGLLQPITVNEAGTLVTGRHRLEAARSLGWETISAVVVEEDDLLNRLAEIDENLQRFDLTVYEQSKHAGERERVLKALGRRATPKNNQHAPATVAGAKTTADVAKEVGMSERSWQQRVKIGEAFGPETRSTLDMADLTDEKQRNFLNSTKQLDTLANISNKRGDETAAKAAMRVLGGDESNIYDAYPEIKKEPKETPGLPSFELPEERRSYYRISQFMLGLTDLDPEAVAGACETPENAARDRRHARRIKDWFNRYEQALEDRGKQAGELRRVK